MYFTFDNTTFSGCIGYRFVAVLPHNAPLKARLQVMVRHEVEYVANQHGYGGGNPPPIANGPIPNIGDSGQVVVGTPQVKPTTQLTLGGFEVEDIDRRRVGKTPLVQFVFKPRDGFIIASLAPNLLPRFGAESAGLLRLHGGGAHRPIKYIDSSGSVLFWRTERHSPSDPLPWMIAQQGQNWATSLSYQFDAPVAAGAGGANPPPALTLNRPGSEHFGVVFEELTGAFCQARHFATEELQKCFEAADNLNSLLDCPLANIVRPQTTSRDIQGINPGGAAEERGAIVFTTPADFPRW